MSKEINRYYNLGKLLDSPVDYNLVKDFIEQYIKIAEKKGQKADDVIMQLKNVSEELHDAILTNCVKIQGDLPVEKLNQINTDEWISVSVAAEICDVKSATIHNWIKTGNPPLISKNLGDRKTLIYGDDLKRFAVKKGVNNNTRIHKKYISYYG